MRHDQNADHFLYNSAEECCATWYPKKANCPHVESETTPNQVAYKPNVSEGYFYPHMSDLNCRFGRNYPMWMSFSSKHYLFTSASECCSRWYPNRHDCPLQEDDGVQAGPFWIVDGAFYPNWRGNWCAQGNDYPEWMSDPTQAATHLFRTADECCMTWFSSEFEACRNNIVRTSGGKQIGGPAGYNPGRWHPALDGGAHRCVDDPPPPEWMNQKGYKSEYVFDSHAECCQAFQCEDVRGKIQY